MNINKGVKWIENIDDDDDYFPFNLPQIPKITDLFWRENNLLLRTVRILITIKRHFSLRNISGN